MLATCNRVEVFAEVERFHGGVDRRQPGARPPGRRRPSRSSRRTSPSTTRTRPSPTCSPSPPGWTRWWSARRRCSASCAPPTRWPARRARSAARCTRSPSGRCGSASGCTPRPASTGPAPRWSRSRSTAPRRASATCAGRPRARRRRRLDGRAGGHHAGPPRRRRRRQQPHRRPRPRGWPTSLGGRAAELADLPARARRRRRAGHLHRRHRHRRAAPTSSPPPWRPATGRPLVVVDLALPRDVDPAVAALPGVHVVDLALLQGEPRGDAGPVAARRRRRRARHDRGRDRACCAPSGRPPTVAPDGVRAAQPGRRGRRRRAAAAVHPAARPRRPRPRPRSPAPCAASSTSCCTSRPCG